VTRFIVLSTQRSGSTWVVDMLNSHPHVLAYSELFMHGGEGIPQWSREQDVPYWQTFVAEKGGGRLVMTFWLWRYLDRAYTPRPGIDAVGFKLMYSQLTPVARPLVPALWLRRARVIHLIRRNALDVVLSKEAGAARRGVLHAREGHAVEAVRIRLRTEDLLERMNAHEREIERARARFRRIGLPYCEVVYEDLVRDEESGFASLFQFLGVRAEPVSSALQKVNPTSHEELIENYGEVREALEGTRFAPQLR